MSKKNIIENWLFHIIVFLWGIYFLLFPFIFSTDTLDIFVLPKQLFLSIITVTSIILWGIKIVLAGKVKIHRTPYDIYIVLILILSIISAFLAMNRFDSFQVLVPFSFLIITYFIIINFFRKENTIFFLLSASTVSSIGISVLAVASYFNLFVLPFPITHAASFTPFGSLIDQAIFLSTFLGITAYFAYPVLKGKVTSRAVIFSISFFILLLGLLITLLQLCTIQKPILLPFEAGFQISFATISQDTGRLFKSFLFGSGFGTFMTDFTRFKQQTFNLNPQVWFINFTQSSSFMLELLATTGCLGFMSFLLLFKKILKDSRKKVANVIYPSLVLLILVSFLLPFSFINLELFFILVALFVSIEGLKSQTDFFDIEFQFVALKKGIFHMQTDHAENSYISKPTKFIPIIFFILFLAFSGVTAFAINRYALSDIIFHKSLIAASNNNGIQTYQEQSNAIKLYPYRDTYYRVFSQTNLALANALVSNQPKDSTPSAQTQKTLYTLIEQSINSARNATSLSPQTATNWQNLSSIYRGIIGFGQNAENFAIVSLQQAIVLDPKNPQNYIALGGIYYQLGQYDSAARIFQTAIDLKPDYSNAHYNLGHAYEAKGDLQSAVTEYQNVKNLVGNDNVNKTKIINEIENIKKKITEKNIAPKIDESKKTILNKQSSLPQEALDINKPKTQLPERIPPVKIPAPTIATSSAE